MAINDISSGGIPPHTTNPSSLGGVVNAPYSVHGNGNPSTPNVNSANSAYTRALCNQHHAPNMANYFPHLNMATGTQIIINHLDINSLKVAANALSRNWSMSGGRSNVYTTPSTFVASSGNKAYLTQWNQICNIFNSLSSSFGVSRTTEISTNSTISVSFYNELVSKFNYYARQCLCNSDCNCNTVCSCNGHCGCNYSDIRLKTNIDYLYTTKLDGKFIKVFEYEYKKEYQDDLNITSDRMVGVMAQDLLTSGLSEYVVQTRSGILGVRYDQIDHIFN